MLDQWFITEDLSEVRLTTLPFVLSVFVDGDKTSSLSGLVLRGTTELNFDATGFNSDQINYIKYFLERAIKLQELHLSSIGSYPNDLNVSIPITGFCLDTVLSFADFSKIAKAIVKKYSPEEVACAFNSNIRKPENALELLSMVLSHIVKTDQKTRISLPDSIREEFVDIATNDCQIGLKVYPGQFGLYLGTVCAEYIIPVSLTIDGEISAKVLETIPVEVLQHCQVYTNTDKVALSDFASDSPNQQKYPIHPSICFEQISKAEIEKLLNEIGYKFNPYDSREIYSSNILLTGSTWSLAIPNGVINDRNSSIILSCGLHRVNSVQEIWEFVESINQLPTTKIVSFSHADIKNPKLLHPYVTGLMIAKIDIFSCNSSEVYTLLQNIDSSAIKEWDLKAQSEAYLSAGTNLAQTYEDPLFLVENSLKLSDTLRTPIIHVRGKLVDIAVFDPKYIKDGSPLGELVDNYNKLQEAFFIGRIDGARKASTPNAPYSLGEGQPCVPFPSKESMQCFFKFAESLPEGLISYLDKQGNSLPNIYQSGGKIVVVQPTVAFSPDFLGGLSGVGDIIDFTSSIYIWNFINNLG
jgi:hypothetical protein